MTKKEMKETLANDVRERYRLLDELTLSYGVDHPYTNSTRTEWYTLQETYKKLFGEEVEY